MGIGILPCALIRYSLWASSGIRIRSLCLSRAPTPLLQYSGLGCPHTNGQNRQSQYQPAILDDFIFASFRLFFNCTVAFPFKKGYTPVRRKRKFEISLWLFEKITVNGPYVKSRPAVKIPVTLSTPGTTLRERKFAGGPLQLFEKSAFIGQELQKAERFHSMIYFHRSMGGEFFTGGFVGRSRDVRIGDGTCA